MSDYTKSTNFATKDNLTPGDPLKIVRGTEIDTEFNNIAIAIATKTDNASAAITGGSITGITDLAIADGGTGASTANAALNNLLPSQASASGKYLKSNGTDSSWDALDISTADITGTLPVANGGTGVTSSTGTGSVVLSNSPTLVTPALGTPASGVATNLTGLPLSTGVTGTLPIANGGTGQTTANAAFNALAPSQATASGKYLKSDGTNTSWDDLDISTADITGTLPVANGGTGVTTSTGTGSVVLSNSPTLVTPALGTPSSATLTNATGLPISTGVSGLGTGVATALAVNVGSAGAPVVNGGALGTPSSGTVTNLTGTASININGTVGATTPTTGAFTTLSASGAFSANGGATLGDASGDALTINSSAVSIPNGLNFDSNTFVIDATNNNIGVGTASPNNYVGYTAVTINSNTTGSILDLNVSGTRTGSLFATVNETRLSSITSVPLVFYAANTERMRLDSSGNLGIGTSSPVGKLDVSGGSIYISTNNNYLYGKQTSGSFRGLLGIDASDYTFNGAYSGFLWSVQGGEKMRLDSSGNLGLGVTPSASTIATMQSTYAAITGNSQVNIAANAYYNGGWKYYATGVQATRYSQLTTSAHVWDVAGSGTAGNAITWTQAMTLNASGNLGVGTTSPSAKLDVNGTSFLRGDTGIYSASGGAVNSSYLTFGSAALINAARVYSKTDSSTAGNLVFDTAQSGTGTLTERARIDSSGRLLVGLTSANTSGSNFQVSSGVTFPATQSASSDANTLDDYEEGTWTPTDASGAGLSFTTSDSFYTKIGNVVYVSCSITFPSTSSTDSIRFGGLPFTVKNGSNNAYAASISQTNTGRTDTFLFARNTTQIGVVTNGNVDVTNATYSTKFISLSGFYFV